MDPPTQHAINEALRILFTSVENENGGPKLRGDFSSDVAFMDHKVKVYESAVKSCLKELVGVKQARNRHVPIHPIHQLLVELFQGIMLDIVPESYGLNWIRGQTSVSKGWCNTILSCPRLWATISSENELDAIPTFLRLSRTMPLTIILDGEATTTPKDEDDFIAAVAPTAQRWGTIHYSGHDLISEMLTDVLASPTPLLSEINFYPTRRSSDIARGTGLVLVGATSLKHVCLHRISMDWTSPRLSNLLSLVLINTHPNGIPTPQAIHQILAASPYLESLELSTAHRALQSEPQPILQLPPLHFHNLRSLKVRNMPVDINYFLTTPTYDAPLTCLRIEYVDIAWMESDLASSLLNAFRALLESPKDPKTRVRVGAYPAGCVATVQSPDHTSGHYKLPNEGAWLQIRGSSVADVLTMINSVLSSTRITLQLESAENPQHFVEILSDAATIIPSISAFESSWAGAHPAVLEFLGTPLNDGWPLHHLDSLTLHGSWDDRPASLVFFERRWGTCRMKARTISGTIAEEASTLPRPAKLKDFVSRSSLDLDLHHVTGVCECGL